MSGLLQNEEWRTTAEELVHPSVTDPESYCSATYFGSVAPFHYMLAADVRIGRQDPEAIATVWTIDQERDRSDVDR